jgi:glycosylphosphatidylinositol transamidase
LVFLIYEHELVGCEAWLNAYFDLNEVDKKDRLIKFDELENREGIIQAAINLDISTELTPNLDIRIEGLNGQLTNLDLFNVVVEIASRESVDATFHEYSHLFSPDQLEVWIEYAKTIGKI